MTNSILSIALESLSDEPKKNKWSIVQEAPEDEENESTDYTSEIDEDQDRESTDYTEEQPESEEEDEDDSPADVEEEDDELEASDYTEEEPDTPEDSSDDDEETSEDDSGTNDESDDTTDDDTNLSDDNSSNEEEEADTKKAEARNQTILHEDYINLYNAIKMTIDKINSIDKSNVIINKSLTRILMNLRMLQKTVWEYVVYDYYKVKYIANLYKYDHLFEALRINVEMLEKTAQFIPNSQNN